MSAYDGPTSYQNDGHIDMDNSTEYQSESYPMHSQPSDGGMGGPPKAASFNSATSFFRSEEMALCQVFLQSEAAYSCVAELGELGLVQFRDMNPDVNAFQRKFVNEVRRCDEMERKLRFIDRQLKTDLIPELDFTDDQLEAPQPREMIDLEATLEKLEHELKEVNQNAFQLRHNYLELTELKHVLQKTQYFFDEQDPNDVMSDMTSNSQHQQLLNTDDDDHVGGHLSGGLKLGFIAGVINRARLPSFERMLWRACRGNVFLRQAEIEESLDDDVSVVNVGTSSKVTSTDGDTADVLKSVFVIFFQGDELKNRVRKICDGFRATIYPCPDETGERREMAVGVMQRLEDLNTVLGQTNDHRQRVLVAAAKNIKMWFVKVRKTKAIYHTLNMFNIDVTEKCLIGECWLPTADVDVIQQALARGAEKVTGGSTMAPILNQVASKHESPPTFFRTNKFTSAFQELVSAYGVASYGECNPAAFAIISFPFLFSVMFGDFGHGLIMLGFGLWMCLRERQLQAQQSKNDSEIWRIFFAGRYLITLMAIFSVYAGLIYNDVFSKSVNIFGSSWHAYQSREAIMSVEKDMISPSEEEGWSGSPYPFGVDPAWQVSENKIIFLNAFKMKLSIILGVIHMLFGLCLSLGNHQHFGDRTGMLLEFVPQITFLGSLFGYMVLLMFHKWSAYGIVYSALADSDGAFQTSERCAPSILITFINMFLFKANLPPDDKCGESSGYMYAGQSFIQTVLVLTALACIPVMLLGRPLALRRAAANNGGKLPVEMQDHGDSSEDPDAPFNMGEALILQSIHTIEFVLSSISHTASYLRLWALSLAHAQLSEVLWTMVLRIGLSTGGWYGGIVLWAIFAFWAGGTVAILCLMEGMSAFLHTLRLHWIEFQSKFYRGQGRQFVPFSFEHMLKVASESD